MQAVLRQLRINLGGDQLRREGQLELFIRGKWHSYLHLSVHMIFARASFRALPWARIAHTHARRAALGGALVAATAAAASPLYLDAPVSPQPLPALTQFVAEPKTSMELPATLQHRGAEMCLVGLGVRRVTFIGINVYVAGLYAERDAVEAAARAHAACAPSAEAIDIERQVREWLDTGVAVGVRVVPVRATDFAHLRDGFVRAVNTRAKGADAEAAREIGAGVQVLKGLFPRARIARGSALDLFAKRDGGAFRLDVVYDGTELGTVVGRGAAPLPAELVLAYVGTRPDISAALRADVRKHLYNGVV